MLAIVMVGASLAVVSGANAQPRQRQRAVAFAEQLGDAFATVAEQSAPTVVSIRVEARRAPAFYGMGAETVRGGGSGVIFRADGHILTNNHVVGTATAIEVRLRDGRTFPARVVGTDPATDLAIIKINARGLRAARFAPRERIRVGEWAIAVGSPFGLDYSVTAGIVSAIGRGSVGMNEIEDYVQTDASINPGNSGGPLMNLRGEVIGINTMIVGRGTGIGFAVVSELAERVAGQIIEGGQVRRSYIGVSFQELTPALAQQVGVPQNTRGALVAGIDPDGPAADSGLQPGDVITQVDGTALRETGDLFRRVLATDVGNAMRFVVLRDGRRRNVTLRTGERGQRSGETPSRTEPSVDRYGMALRADGSRGVRVRRVEPGSLAAGAGLMQNDLIVEADRRPARQPAQVRRALRDGQALLRVRRGRGALFIAIRTERPPARPPARRRAGGRGR